MLASQSRFDHIEVTSTSYKLKVRELTTSSTTESANQRLQRAAVSTTTAGSGGRRLSLVYQVDGARRRDRESNSISSQVLSVINTDAGSCARESANEAGSAAHWRHPLSCGGEVDRRRKRPPEWQRMSHCCMPPGSSQIVMLARANQPVLQIPCARRWAQLVLFQEFR